MADLMKALRNADAAGDTEAAQRIFAMIQAQNNIGPTTQQPQQAEWMPTEANLAVQQPQKPERSWGDIAEGAGEAALAIGTGATTGALGMLGGTIEGAARELTGNIPRGEGMKVAQQRAASGINLPESEAGQEYVKAIGDVLGLLPPVGLTGGVTPKLAVPKFQSRNKAINAINETSPLVKKSFEKKLGNDRFQPRIWGMVKEARRQGFDDSVTTLIANANPITRKRMIKQVETVEVAKGDARAKALLRTADEAGGALIKQIDFVKNKNKQAGSQLGEVATKFKDDKVNMVGPVNSFIKSMNDELGVTFEKSMKPIFKGSDIETFPESMKLVNDLALKIKRSKSPTALDAHKFKRLIDKSVTYGKSDGKLDKDLEHIAKKLRGDINDTLSAKYPEYKAANKQFSETITVLDDLQNVAGRKLDFAGRHANKAAGTLLRSQTNNTGKRANLLTAIEDLELTAKKYDGNFNDDILALSIFADELDAVFGSGARTSLRGEVGKANVDAAIDISQMTIPGALAVGAKAGAKYLRRINEKNQLKSIKKLLSDKE